MFFGVESGRASPAFDDAVSLAWMAGTAVTAEEASARLPETSAAGLPWRAPRATSPGMLPFAKMNGIGNSILVVDERGRTPSMTGAMARRLSAGDLAFEQMMVLSDAARPGFDAAVRIFNQDGSRAGACGNGTRCLAWFMGETGSPDRLTLDIDGTAISCSREGPVTFTVDMGTPGLDWQDIPLRQVADTLAVDLGPILDEAGLQRPVAVSIGNPHAVFFVPHVAAVDLPLWGPRLERHPMFPDRANISFAEVQATDRVALRVWERGAGPTLACGSAACATLVAASRRGLAGRHARVALPGGDLEMAWREDGHVLMTGPVALEHRGHLEPSTGDRTSW